MFAKPWGQNEASLASAADEIAFLSGWSSQASLANAHAVFARPCGPSKSAIFAMAADESAASSGGCRNARVAQDHEVVERPCASNSVLRAMA